MTTMLGAPVERTTDGIGHTRRAASSQGPTRSGSAAHAAGSHTRAPGRGVDKRASAAVLEERARIARELHDSVSQTLYAITLGAMRARMLVERNDAADAQPIIDDVLQLATAGQSELRALLTDLRSDRLTSAGLTTALAKFAADARTRDGLDIRLSLIDEPNAPAATKEALAMIVREALHNVVKHSGAGRIDIVLERDGERLLLLIVDNGRGFDTATPRPGHFGLQSMRERASAVGGTLALRSAVGLGTQVRMSVPAHWGNDG